MNKKRRLALVIIVVLLISALAVATVSAQYQADCAKQGACLVPNTNCTGNPADCTIDAANCTTANGCTPEQMSACGNALNGCARF